ARRQAVHRLGRRGRDHSGRIYCLPLTEELKSNPRIRQGKLRIISTCSTNGAQMTRDKQGHFPRNSRRGRTMLSGLLFCAAAAVILLVVLVAMPPKMKAQDWSNTSEWPTYGADLASTRYRPFDQINASNFNKLEVAWTFKTDNLGPMPEFRLEGTPLMVGGVVYATAGTRKDVVTLDAATGELLWMHSVNEGER